MRSFIKSVIFPLAVTLPLIGLCGCVHSTEFTTYPDDLSGHVAETVEEGLVIDLDIDQPGAVVLGEYGTSSLRADEEMMVSFLDCISDSMKSVAVDEWLDGEHHYAVRTEKGAYAEFVQPEEGVPAATVWSYYAPGADEYNYAVNDYYGAGRSVNSRDNTSQYFEPREFSFASYEEALRDAKNVLGILGLTDLDLVETLYLDHGIMNDCLKTDNARALIEHYGMQHLADRGYDSSYDAYSFRFSLSKDGIPLFEDAFGNTTVGYAAPDVVVRINCNGVFDVHVFECSLIVEKPENSGQAYPAGRILSAVKDLLQDTINPNERWINGLKLRYIYWKDENRLLLKPVWIVSVLEREAGHLRTMSDDQREDRYTYFIYDATTGELLCSA